MSYVLRRFLVTTGSGGGGTIAADQINQFLMLNPGITPVSLTISWRYGRSRADQYYLSLAYRGGSVPVRSWCIQFQSTATLTAEAQATTFFANNPSYAPICTQVVTRPGIVTTSRRLLVIYATLGYLQPQCIRQAVSAAPSTGLAVGAIGSMYDTLDLTRPAIPVLNLGNDVWPAGGANLAVTRIGNNPDLCAFGGIAPGCYAGAGIAPPAPLLPTLLCGHCFPPDVPTVTTTSTTSTSTSSTSSTSTTTFTGTTTTTTSTSTTSTSSTSTTTLSTLSTTSTTTTSTSTTTTLSTTTTTITSAPSACSTCAITQPNAFVAQFDHCPGSGISPQPGTAQFDSYEDYRSISGLCIWNYSVITHDYNYAVAVTFNGSTFKVLIDGWYNPGPATLTCCPNGKLSGTVGWTVSGCYPSGNMTFVVQFNGGGGC